MRVKDVFNKACPIISKLATGSKFFQFEIKPIAWSLAAQNQIFYTISVYFRTIGTLLLEISTSIKLEAVYLYR